MIGLLVAFGPSVVFAVASLACDLVAATGRDPIGIWQVLPLPLPAGGWIAIESVSVAFFLVALGLARAKAAFWWVALVALGWGVAVQAGPASRLPAVLAAVALAVVLVATRRRHDVPTSPRRLGMALAAFAIGGLASGASVTIAALAIDVGLVALLEPARDPRPPAEVRAARVTLRRLGRGALLPYQLGPEVVPVREPGGEAALAYGRAGRQAVAIGDPAGEPTQAARLFDAWAEEARRRDWQPVVYQASSRFADHLRRRGWHAIRIGEEAIVDPASFDLASPRVANLRHTVTRSRKAGIEVCCSADGLGELPSAASGEALAALDREWRRQAGPRLGFTVGRFDLGDLDGCVIAVAIDPEGRTQAFVVLRPTGDGSWMLDVMRRRRGGPPGALEATLVAGIEHLRERGASQLSLGLVPLGGLDPGTGLIEERALAVAGRAIRPVYDVAGLRFFKSKLSPAWEPRFLAVRHRWGYGGAAVALLRLHLGGSWPRMIAALLGHEPAARSRTPSGSARTPVPPTGPRPATRRAS